MPGEDAWQDLRHHRAVCPCRYLRMGTLLEKSAAESTLCRATMHGAGSAMVPAAAFQAGALVALELALKPFLQRRRRLRRGN